MEFENKSFLDFPGLQTYDSKIKDHIDKKIVQSDWKQNDTAAADYIKNRIGGYTQETIEVYKENEEFDFTTSNLLSLDITEQNIFQEDSNIIITINGVEYNTTGEKISWMGNELICFGNKYIIVGSPYPDTGEPFGISINKNNPNILNFKMQNKDKYIISISKIGSKIVKIPSEMLELTQTDWEQNDESAIDYIKNRTHWIDSETETTVYYDNLTFYFIVDNNTAPEIIDENVKGIDVSKEVTVIWDNIEYNLIPTKPESASVYGIGNWGLVDPSLYEYTTVPFLIQLQEGLPYHMWLNPTTGEEHTISMYQSEEKEVFHELDENFIPDTIQRVADNIGKPGAGSNSEIFNYYIGNIAEGSYSHAEGYSADAIGNFSHAENYCTTAEGYGAHAEGGFAKANGEYSHAEGNGTIAQGPNSHAEGNNTTASGENSHAEGNSTNNALTIISDLSIDQDVLTAWETQKFSLAKNNSHTEGRDNLALGKNSHAEGSTTQALSEEAHAEGHQTIANGWFSHAEGNRTIASGDASHAEGIRSEASGRYSHAEGQGTVASGYNSHTEGNHTIAVSNNQHVQGKNNISDADEEGNALNTYAHIVGNGLSPMKRSNAHTLDWNGNGWYAGDLYVGGTSQEDATRVATIADLYPVGAIYLSTVETSPASFFGGTWEQIKDTFLLAAGDTYTAGTTGGSATVTLTEAQMPEHKHKTVSSVVYNATGEGTTKGYQWNDTGADDWGTQYVDSAGQSQPHENMPPYLAVYVWKRIE